MSDDSGELFIKPCVPVEVDFYQSANRRHPEFADLMPLFMGTLSLDDPKSVEVAGAISATGDVTTAKEQIAAVVANATASAPEDESAPGWTPKSKSKKIKTNTAIVLENSSHGFTQPNILDAKLGIRLWADDAPMEKKQRFDKITAATTHAKLGFRIAGMRVYHGSDDPLELDEDGYKVYDKDFGRVSVSDDNIVDVFHKFVFNKSAGIDEELGKAVCTAFAQDVKQVEDIMTRHESRMYSASLLFVFEGDGAKLRSAIEQSNAAVDEARAEKIERTTKRVDSGIVLEDDDDDDLEADLSSLPRVYSLKLIDFAHAEWTPGQGPDENSLVGVRSLGRIFEELAQ